MNANSEAPWIDVRQFDENQRNFPPEERARYEGRHIAWNWDGSRILASAPILELRAILAEAGHDPHHVVYDSADPLLDAAFARPEEVALAVNNLYPGA